MNNELLDWVESAALENIRAHIKSADDIKREGYVALALILTGAAGSLTYTASALSGPPRLDLVSVFAVLTLYLFALGAFLVWNCLRIGTFPAPTNEPRNLYQKDYALDDLREVELENMQVRIELAAQNNVRRSAWLNGVLCAATASPLVAAAALLVYSLVQRF